jgi:hypothetical protein
MSDPRTAVAETATASPLWKGAPAWMAVMADKVFGMSLNDWVLVLAAIYTILQIIVLMRNNFFRRSYEMERD